MSCLTDDEVLKFVRGGLARDTLDVVDEHIDVCPDCRRLIADCVHGEADGLPSADYGAPGDCLEHGDRIGRYLVLRSIGRGAMGVVYAAYDSDLDRQIAIKVISPELSEVAGQEHCRDRLAREAQALARLSHPNVIGVHEVGNTADAVFVAMELVDGETLGDWAASQVRSSREVGDVFLQIGAGLSAAHDAGLVHRDIKPENLLVGRDGRVRITDFGLARPFSDPRERHVVDSMRAPESGLDLPPTTMTRTGTIIGTPAYMAPEQLAGGEANVRTDQFSYCVVLHEVLFGSRPFAGATLGELTENVQAGRRVVPPSGRKVSSALAVVLGRGLKAEPAERFPSMSALLSDLTAAFERRSLKRFVWLGVAFAAAAVAAGVLIGRGDHAQDAAAMCARSGEELRVVWNEDRQSILVAALSKGGHPDARDMALRSAAAIDDYAKRWSSMHRRSCEATHLRGIQSAHLLDRRSACLANRLSDLRALVQVLTVEPAPGVVNEAFRAIQSLPPMDECADVEALLSAVPLPAKISTRTRVRVLQEQLSQVNTLCHLGQYSEALELATEVVAHARELDYPYFLAEALYTRTCAMHRISDSGLAERDLEEALQIAAAARDPRFVAEIATHLVARLALQPTREDEAIGVARLAEAEIVQTGSKSTLLGILAAHRGLAFQRKGALDEARQQYQLAIALLREHLGPHHLDVADALFNLSLVAGEQGHFEEQLAALRESQDIRERNLGPRHPVIGDTLCARVEALRNGGRNREAAAEARRALDIYIEAYGEESASVATALNLLASTMDRASPESEALPLTLRALAIRQEVYGHEHYMVAVSLSDLCVLYIMREAYGDAQRECGRAVEIVEKQFGPEHSAVAPYLLNLGSSFNGDEKWEDAIPHLERSAAVYQQWESNPANLASARFELARALDGVGSNRRRATQLLADARVGYRSAGEQAASMLAELDAYLAERPKT